MGETRLCQVRAPLTRHLNRAKVVVVAAILVHHVETMVVAVELVAVMGWLCKMELDPGTESRPRCIFPAENGAVTRSHGVYSS